MPTLVMSSWAAYRIGANILYAWWIATGGGTPSGRPLAPHLASARTGEREEILPDFTVAVIEADPGASDSVTTVLETAGAAVQCFTSAESFFDLYVPGAAACLISAAQLPGGDVLDVQKKLAHMKSRLPVIILTGHGDIPLAVAAMKNGAIDFIEIPFDAERLLRSVKIGLYRGTNDRRKAARVDLIKLQAASLTPRELEVFRLLLGGEGNKVMARTLGISIRTLEVHRAHLMAKMEARSLADLVRVGMLAGIWRP